MSKTFPQLKKAKDVINHDFSRWFVYLALAVLMLVVTISPSLAEDLSSLQEQLNQTKIAVDTGWILFTGSLVFFMNPGFAMVETGFCRRQNAINVLAKNLIVFCLATVAFWAVGYSFMFGKSYDFIGLQGFFLIGFENNPTEIPLKAQFFFQLTFAGTAATIVSGAVAERIKFPAFLIFSLLLVGFSYPITGRWVWGEGWLYGKFFDFAGSTLVHAVGGCAGLVGALFLGPRLNKYEEIEPNSRIYENLKEKSPQELTYKKILGIRSLKPDHRINSFGGHNLSLATLGCLILWFGWFGFNAGSTLELNSPAVAHILVNTLVAGATGGIIGTLSAWFMFDNKPSLTFIINGILAGCVSITASCAYVHLLSAVFIGMVGGWFVVWATDFIDRFGIDDPVGAIPVHLFCGFWGTLAVGFFSAGPGVVDWYPGLESYPKLGLLLAIRDFTLIEASLEQLREQFWGFLCIATMTTGLSFVFWLISGGVVGIIYRVLTGKFDGKIRVSNEEESQGLDRSFSDEGEGLREKLYQLAHDNSVEKVERNLLFSFLSLLPEDDLNNFDSINSILEKTEDINLIDKILKRIIEHSSDREEIQKEWKQLDEYYNNARNQAINTTYQNTIISILEIKSRRKAVTEEIINKIKDKSLSEEKYQEILEKARTVDNIDTFETFLKNLLQELKE